MPYKDVSQLPESIKKLPHKAQILFLKAFNEVDDKYDEETSFEIAWGVVKKKFKKVDGKWIAKGMSNEVYTFNIDIKEDLFIQKADDGNYYIEGVLSDILPDMDGFSPTPELLENWANQINDMPIFGGITHEEWNELKMKYAHLPEEEFIAKARSERKGILKTVKAIYEKGKLIIKAIVDKRYINHVKKFNKMSLEALVPKKYQVGTKYTGGTILGFALDNNAVNQRSSVTHY